MLQMSICQTSEASGYNLNNKTNVDNLPLLETNGTIFRTSYASESEIGRSHKTIMP